MRPAMRKATVTTATVAAASTAALVAAALGVSAVNRRWARADGSRDAAFYDLPDGEQLQITTHDGAELSVLTVGTDPDQPTVVLSHCWTGDTRFWAPLVRLLAGDHRVVLYEQRGHGRSTIGSEGCTIDALAADLRDVVEQLDLRGIVISGHSMGGMATQAFVINHPEVAKERVAGLALVATACDGLDTSPFGRTVAPSIAMQATTRAVGHRSLGPVLVRGTVGQRARLIDLAAVAETFAATPAATRGQLLEAMRVMDLSEGLATVDLPVVVLAGTRDLLTPLARNQRIVDLVDGARLEIIDGAGHMLPCEAPERIASVISELARAADRGFARTAS